MKKALYISLLFLAHLACAQGVRFNGIAFTTNLSAPQPGGLYPVLAIPNATIQICTGANPCALVTTYTDQTDSVACPANAQITRAGSGQCFSTADNLGNWGVWLPAGTYSYVITSSTGTPITPNPVPFTVGGIAAASGTVTDGSGTTTAGIIPESTTTAHQLDYNSLLSIIAGVLTYTGTGGISSNGTTHGVIVPAGSAPSGAASKAIYASDAINGYAEGNENNTGLSRFCTLLNGQCASLTASLTTTAATSDNVTVTGMVSTGHCLLFPTNASAATNIATTYVSAKTTNQITVTHTATSGMTYDVVCTVN